MRRRGFTLTEAVVALAIGLVVLSIALGFLWWGTASFRRSEDRLDARESVRSGLAHARTLLQDAWAYELAADGNELAFDGPRGRGLLRYSDGALNLVLRGRSQPLIGNLTNCRMIAFRPGFLRIYVELPRPFTMFEEIWIPAAAAKRIFNRVF